MPSSQFSQVAIIAVGTTTGVKVYVPCRLFRRYEGASVGGSPGLYVSIDEHIGGIEGECISLEACWNLEQARKMLNSLLPQAKVDQILAQCWSKPGQSQKVRVLARVVDRIREQIKRAELEATSASANSVPVSAA